MGFQYSALQGTEVTISGSINTSAAVPQPNADQTIFNYVHTGTGSIVVIHTVTAGKKFYLMGVVGLTSAAAATMLVYENDGTTKVIQFKIPANNNFGVPATCPIAVYDAADEVKINHPSDTVMTIWGYEA